MRLWKSLDGSSPERKGAIDRRHGAGPHYQFAGVPYTAPMGSLDLDRVVRDQYERDVWVWRIIDARAKNASRLPIQIMNGRGKDAMEIEKHPLGIRLNRKANRYETAQAFRYRLHSLLDLSVTKGVFVEVIENGAGEIASLHLLNPLHTWPVPHPETFIDSFHMRLPSGETFDLPPYRKGQGGVLWIKRHHPLDPYRSTSWLEAAGLTVELDYYARLYNRNFLLNDGRPGGVLMVKSEDGIDPADAAVLQQRMSGGPGVAGKVTIMEADGLEYHDLSTTPRDAQYVEGRSVTQRELLVAGGTPLSVIGDASGRTFDNADAEYAGFWRSEMVPECELVGSFWEELTHGGIEDDSEVVVYDYSGIAVLERDARAEETRLLLLLEKGAISYDEFREKTGREPRDLPGTRVLWLPAGKAPVGDEKDVTALLTQGMEKPQPDQAALPPGEEAGPPALPPGEEPPPFGGDVVDGEVVDDEEWQTKALKALDSDYLARRRREHAELIDRWEKAVGDELLALFRRQEEVVASRLKGAKARKHTRHWTYATPYNGELKALDAAYIVERRRWIEEVVEAIAELIMQAFGAAGQAAIKQVGSGQTFAPGEAAAEVVARTVRMIAEGFDARAGRLQEIIADADEAGRPMDEIAEEVREAFTSADTWAAVTSRQVVGAMNAGSLIGATQVGALRKRWLATDDERTRLTHKAAEGQVVGVGESFLVGEAELHFPGDPTGPIGEWINCRCTMLYQLGRKTDAQREDELDADLEALERAEAGWKARRPPRIGGFARVNVDFDPRLHPRDHRGRFLDVPDVNLPDGSRGVAVAQEANGDVTVAKADGDVVTVKPGALTTGPATPAPKPSTPKLTTEDFEGRVGDPDHITRNQRGTIPTGIIATLPGVKGEKPGEHRARKGEEWEAFKADIAERGILEPIFITVEPDGTARISEGNHRRDAAVELGLTDVPVLIRYFGHGERNATLLPAPDPAERLAELDARMDDIDDRIVDLAEQQTDLDPAGEEYQALEDEIDALYEQSDALYAESRRLRPKRPKAPTTFDPLTFRAPNETPVRWQLAKLDDGRYGQVVSNPRDDGSIDVIVDGEVLSVQRDSLVQASPEAPVPFTGTRPDSAERHVWCAQGHRHWGAAGAAGVLIRHRGEDGEDRYLLQLRGPGVNKPGTWSTPGGALHVGESVEDGAVRETLEEMGVLPGGLTIAGVNSDRHGGWAYSTVTVDAPTLFLPQAGKHDGEQVRAAWFTEAEMDELPLHPGFEATWRATEVDRWIEKRMPKKPVTMVVPCAGKKLDHAAPARELYDSANFRMTLAAAEAVVADEGGRVLILSAKYGLLGLDDVVEPYDVKMGTGDPEEVAVETLEQQLVERGLLDDEMYALLPNAYLGKLDQASRNVDGPPVQDVYEADAGLGYQRGTVKTVRETYRVSDDPQAPRQVELQFLSVPEESELADPLLAEAAAALPTEGIPGVIDPDDLARKLPRDQRLGRSYELAGAYTLNPGGSLVHGTISGDGLEPLEHAWIVRDDGDVYEPSSGHRMSYDEFEGAFQPVEQARYTRTEAAAAMLRYAHYGPWHVDAPAPAVAPFSALEERLVNYKPDRNLADPTQTIPLTTLLPDADYVPYSEVPYLAQMHRLMGIDDPLAIDVPDYMAARDELFTDQPLVEVPFDSVVVTQQMVNGQRVGQIVAEPETGGSKPQHFVRFQGRTYVMNGHHRVAAQIAGGDTAATGHLLDLDAMGYRGEPEPTTLTYGLDPDGTLPYLGSWGRTLYRSARRPGRRGSHEDHLRRLREDEPEYAAWLAAQEESVAALFAEWDIQPDGGPIGEPNVSGSTGDGAKARTMIPTLLELIDKGMSPEDAKKEWHRLYHNARFRVRHARIKAEKEAAKAKAEDLNTHTVLTGTESGTALDAFDRPRWAPEGHNAPGVGYSALRYSDQQIARLAADPAMQLHLRFARGEEILDLPFATVTSYVTKNDDTAEPHLRLRISTSDIDDPEWLSSYVALVASKSDTDWEVVVRTAELTDVWTVPDNLAKLTDDGSGVLKAFAEVVQQDLGSTNEPGGGVVPKALYSLDWGVKQQLKKAGIPPGPGAVKPGKTWADNLSSAPDGVDVPVVGLTIQGHTVAHGTARKIGGMPYLLEHAPSATAEEIEAQFKNMTWAWDKVSKRARPSLRKHQEGFAWLKGKNPGDEHWSKKYGYEFVSAATGGDGTTTFWNTKPNTDVVSHEFGHNIDSHASHDGKGYLWLSHEGDDAPIAATPHDAEEGTPEHVGSYSEARLVDETQSAFFAQAIAVDGLTASDILIEVRGTHHPIRLGDKGPTTYGSSNEREDFAEATRLYLKDRALGRLAYIRPLDESGNPLAIDPVTGQKPVGVNVRFADLFPARAAVLDRIHGNKPVDADEPTEWQKQQTAAMVDELVPLGLDGYPSDWPMANDLVEKYGVTGDVAAKAKIQALEVLNAQKLKDEEIAKQAAEAAEKAKALKDAADVAAAELAALAYDPGPKVTVGGDVELPADAAKRIKQNVTWHRWNAKQEKTKVVKTAGSGVWGDAVLNDRHALEKFNEGDTLKWTDKDGGVHYLRLADYEDNSQQTGFLFYDGGQLYVRGDAVDENGTPITDLDHPDALHAARRTNEFAEVRIVTQRKHTAEEADAIAKAYEKTALAEAAVKYGLAKDPGAPKADAVPPKELLDSIAAEKAKILKKAGKERRSKVTPTGPDGKYLSSDVTAKIKKQSRIEWRNDDGDLLRGIVTGASPGSDPSLHVGSVTVTRGKDPDRADPRPGDVYVLPPEQDVHDGADLVIQADLSGRMTYLDTGGGSTVPTSDLMLTIGVNGKWQPQTAGEPVELDEAGTLRAKLSTIRDLVRVSPPTVTEALAQSQADAYEKQQLDQWFAEANAGVEEAKAQAEVKKKLLEIAVEKGRIANDYGPKKTAHVATTGGVYTMSDLQDVTSLDADDSPVYPLLEWRVGAYEYRGTPTGYNAAGMTSQGGFMKRGPSTGDVWLPVPATDGLQGVPYDSITDGSLVVVEREEITPQQALERADVYEAAALAGLDTMLPKKPTPEQLAQIAKRKAEIEASFGPGKKEAIGGGGQFAREPDGTLIKFPNPLGSGQSEVNGRFYTFRQWTPARLPKGTVISYRDEQGNEQLARHQRRKLKDSRLVMQPVDAEGNDVGKPVELDPTTWTPLTVFRVSGIKSKAKALEEAERYEQNALAAITKPGAGTKAPTLPEVSAKARTDGGGFIGKAGHKAHPLAKQQGGGVANQAKANIAAELGSRLNNRDDWELFRAYRIGLAGSLGPGLISGADKYGKVPNDPGAFDDVPENERQRILDQETSNRVGMWASTSGDSNPWAVMMLRAVAEEFDSGGVWQPGDLQNTGWGGAMNQQTFDASWPHVREFYRRFARAMYDHTQEEFAAEGITEIAGYRGMRNKGTLGWRDKHGVQDATVTGTMKPGNSWATSLAIAQRFSSSNGTGRIVTATVPVSRILGTARTGFGCLSEWEFVVINGPGNITIYNYGDSIPTT